MNCSALSLARPATNGCTMNNAFHAVSPVVAATMTATAAATTTTTNGLCTRNINTKSTAINNLMISNQLSAANKSITAIATATLTTNSVESNKKSKKPEVAAKIIQQSDIVCFDVDSTVIREEGIDELAEFCGKGADVARVTKEAMGGAMTFQDALNIRLNIIRPTQTQIAEFIKLRPSTLTRNVQHFIEHLKAAGKQVYLISGGFDCLIAPVANELGIPLTNLFANKLLFHGNGEYASFDTTQPTSKSGGKAEAIKIIKKHNPNALITMIGDGATDLEAVPPANYFIGFGGNVVREGVYERAQYYVTDFEQLM